MTGVVMVFHFDQDQSLVLGLSGPFVNDLVLLIHGHHHNLVILRHNLKEIDLSQTTGPFGHACLLVQLTSQPFLDRTTLTYIFIPRIVVPPGF